MFLLLSVGAIAGVLLALSRGEPKDSDNIAATPAGQIAVSAPDLRVSALEKQVNNLQTRLTALEKQLAANQAGSSDGSEFATAQSLEAQTATTVPAFQTSTEPVSVTDALIIAGLNTFEAENIARKQSEFELRRLELRDQAMRDGTIGNDEYRQKISALRQEQTQIRDEIDPNVYDRYLYHTGQPNRIAVQSVMLGSTAEVAGLQPGDMLLSYDDSTIYNYRDLRTATLDGEKNESVNVRLIRDDTEMTISVERGPLGVRLDSLRVDPEGG